MILSEEEKAWWSNSTPPEIMEKYDISSATLSRWQSKNNVKAKRKTGSGSNNPRLLPLKKCNTCGKPHKNTLYCSYECKNNSSEFRAKLASVDKSYMQSIEYRKTLMRADTSDYKKYYGRVYRLTETVYNSNVERINPDNHKRGLCGVEGAWQLDHIIPIRFGFDNGIPPEVLADVNNLQMLPWRDNLLKGKHYE